MNLVTDMPRLNGLQASTMGWLLSSDIRLGGGFASSRRLLLYGLYRSIQSRRRAAFMVTTAAEAIEGLNRNRPSAASALSSAWTAARKKPGGKSH
jgi:hypothetical protein